MGDDTAGAHGGDDVGPGRRHRGAGRGQHAPVEVAHGDVEVERVVQLADAPGQHGAIAQPLGREGSGVAGHPLPHLAEAAAAVDEGEHQARRHADDEQDGQRVQVDAGVQPHRAGPGRTSA